MRGGMEHSPPATGQCYAFNIEDVRHSFVTIAVAVSIHGQARVVVNIYAGAVKNKTHRKDPVNM